MWTQGAPPGLSPSQSPRACPAIDGASWKDVRLMCSCMCLGWWGGRHREGAETERQAVHSQCPRHGARVQDGSSDSPSSGGQGPLPSPHSPFSSALSNSAGGTVVSYKRRRRLRELLGSTQARAGVGPRLLPSVGGRMGCPPPVCCNDSWDSGTVTKRGCGSSCRFCGLGRSFCHSVPQFPCQHSTSLVDCCESSVG